MSLKITVCHVGKKLFFPNHEPSTIQVTSHERGSCRHKKHCTKTSVVTLGSLILNSSLHHFWQDFNSWVADSTQKQPSLMKWIWGFIQGQWWHRTIPALKYCLFLLMDLYMEQMHLEWAMGLLLKDWLSSKQYKQHTSFPAYNPSAGHTKQ